MFTGRFEHTIDTKGRVSLPAKFREILRTTYDDRLVVTNFNFDKCLVAYPGEEWRIMAERVNSLSMVKKEVRSFQRFFFSGASECPTDKLGRILLPLSLREYAHLEKEIVFVGMINKIEIWNKKEWERIFCDSQENIPEMEETLSELGLMI